MDTPEAIAEHVLSKLPGDPRRATSFTQCLKVAIAAAIEASLLTDEGRKVTFSLLLDIDAEGRGDGPNEWMDASWKPEIPCKPRPLTARDLAANSRLSKAGETFFQVQRADLSPAERPRVWVSAITRPPRTFNREFLPDGRHLGVTVLGPFHLIIEAHGGEILYVRAGQISKHDSRVWPRRVYDTLSLQESNGESANSIPPFITSHTLNRIGRAMWLSATGGTIAILAPDESDPDDGDWRLSGDPLSTIGLIFDEYAEGQNLGRSEYDNDHENALKLTRSSRDAEIAAENGIADLARFTQLDGAVILRADLKLAGFGRKLKPDQASLVYFRTDEMTGELTQVESLGGTRHTSAAHWVAEKTGRLALVASQDRRLAWIFRASNEERAVEYWPWRPRLF